MEVEVPHTQSALFFAASRGIKQRPRSELVYVNWNLPSVTRPGIMRYVFKPVKIVA